MKTKLKLFLWVLTLGIFFIGCDKNNDTGPITEVDDAVSEEPIDDAVEMGTVSLNTFIKDVIEVTTGKAPTLDEVLDNIIVEIKDSDNAIVISDNYRNLPESIELAPNSGYSLSMRYPEMEPARFDFPMYGHHPIGTPIFFDIISGQNTVVEVELNLLDVAVTINLSEEIKLNYPDIEVETFLSYSEPAFFFPLTWQVVDDSRSGYFHVGYLGAISSDMSISITATNEQGIVVNVEKFYVVTANQHYNIKIEQTVDGSASFDVTLGDEEVIDDTITFPN